VQFDHCINTKRTLTLPCSLNMVLWGYRDKTSIAIADTQLKV